MNSELGLSRVQRDLLNGALKDVHFAREKARGIQLMQRYGGQPKLVSALKELDGHMQRLWHLLDGLDPSRVGSSHHDQAHQEVSLP